jgi:hypothetical protein
VKRVSILLLLLMAFVAACGGSPSATDTDTDTETPDPTAEATSEPTEEASTDPGASGGSSFEGDLADVIPDELNGVARTDIPGMDSILTSMFGAQGIDASQAQFAFATYGDGTDAVTLTAIVVPDIDDATLELISRSFSGLPEGASAETVTIDGKTVLKVTAGAAQPGSVYMYFAGGAAFTVFSQNEDLAEQLLGELP